jgi:uncharacterized protein (TIGR03435 family)
MQNPQAFRRAFLLAATGIVAASAVNGPRAQAPATDTKPPAFELASIKPNKSGSNQTNFSPQPGGRFTATNVSVLQMIHIAYGTPVPLPFSNILAGPNWIFTDHFDIIAKAEGNPTNDEFSLMLRALLAERFKLSVRHESRDRPIFALVLARSDGRLGPRLRRTNVDCSTPRTDTPSLPVAGRSSHTPSPCTLGNYPGKLTATSIPMATLARMLVSWVDDHREVRDQTGLTGTFEVAIEWTPDRVSPVALDAPVEVGRAVAAIDPNGPSLFTAVQEQLGLKLQPKKDQADVLVIDHVEQPTPD